MAFSLTAGPTIYLERTPHSSGVTRSSNTGRLQNYPVISSATTASEETTLRGTLNSRPLQRYTVQFFSSPSGEEGQALIGSTIFLTIFLTDDAGTAVAAGQQVTAAASTLCLIQLTGVRGKSKFSAVCERTVVRG